MLAQLEEFVSKRLVAKPEQIQSFCQHWKIVEMAIFGSVLRDDFRPDSDIDFLVKFDPASEWTLFDYIHMIEELEELLHRKVDIAEEKGLVNPYRRHSILSTCRTIYKVQYENE